MWGRRREREAFLGANKSISTTRRQEKIPGVAPSGLRGLLARAPPRRVPPPSPGAAGRGRGLGQGARAGPGRGRPAPRGAVTPRQGRSVCRLLAATCRCPQSRESPSWDALGREVLRKSPPGRPAGLRSGVCRARAPQTGPGHPKAGPNPLPEQGQGLPDPGRLGCGCAALPEPLGAARNNWAGS